MLPEPFDMPLDDFLCGPDGGDLDVDRIFAKSFERVLEEFSRDAPDDLVPKGDARASLVIPGLTYRDTPAGVILLDGHVPIGGYLSCDLSLRADYQGMGLGAEIVIERCLRDGESPVWALDSAAYSPAGLAAHAGAWRRVRENPEETAERVRRTASLPFQEQNP